MSSRIMWVAVLRALYLQALHPRVIRGTLQNATTITDPADAWARLRRTRTFIETRTFGTTAEAERAGAVFAGSTTRSPEPTPTAPGTHRHH